MYPPTWIFLGKADGYKVCGEMCAETAQAKNLCKNSLKIKVSSESGVGISKIFI